MSIAQTIQVTGIDAVYYYVTDFDRALEFYRDTLGLDVTMSAPEMFAEFTVPGGESFGIYKSHDPETFMPGTGVMFAVDDVKASIAALKAGGHSVSDMIEDTPACYMGFAEDTEGNKFILHQRKT